jgi:hypothetical protein
MLRLIAISHSGCVIDRFGDANGFKFMVRNGEQNFAEIIIPIKKSFLQIFGAMKELVVSAFCCANIACGSPTSSSCPTLVPVM